MSDIFDGGGVGATAPSEQFGGLLSQPPLSPAIARPTPTPTPPPPTVSEPEPAPPEPAPPEPEAHAPGMLERKLLQFGLVTMDQLGEAMREEAATGRPVAGILIERGWITEEQIAQLFAPAPTLALAPEPVAVAAAELPPQPAPEPALPAQVPPEPIPEPAPAFAPPPEPVAEVAPVVQEPYASEPATDFPMSVPSSLAFHLYIRLSTGERIDANTFSDLNDARLHAEDLVKKLASNSHVWPHFGGRYIRPEAIISIDVEAAPV